MSPASRSRVLFALPSLRGGGAERVIVTLLHHLDRDRFEPHLVLVEGTGPYFAHLPRDVPVHVLAAPRLRRAMLDMVRVIRRVRPTIVVSTQGYMNLALLGLRPFFPRARLIVREVIGERYLENSRFRALFYRVYLRLVRRADRIVVQSDAVRCEMEARLAVAPGRVVRVYNPVDTARIDTAARVAPPLHDSGRPHVVAAGRLDHQKGFDLLLEAFQGVVRILGRGTLTILGDGPDRATLEARAAELGIASAVRFAGFQENPFAYFAAADLFVLSSRYEGLPNVVLEALACGCPAVAFDCPHGVREIVRDGMNGVLVPPEDVPSLRAAMLRVLQDSDERLRLAANARASLEPFLVATIVRQWEALLDQVR
ncbi:MAG: glycosyltransferase [Deltaproteobacteria bacterium]|nr:glycosyltransferase [Deltaproteobacteria bacterium]